MKYKAFLGQDYEKLKLECLENKRLFEDDKFPANNYSLYRGKTSPFSSSIVWKRPHEFLDNPQFIIDNIHSSDLDQGQLGNCWVIASFSAVLNIKEYQDRIVPADQSFEKHSYAGIFYFRFWFYGEWVSVVIDDRLPFDAKTNRLIFCRNKVDKNELFGSLLEKAYAKLNLCYEFLISGDPNDCLIDLTGGVKERFETKRCSDNQTDFIHPEIVWQFVFKSLNLKSILTCWSDIKSSNAELIVQNGLALGHAYSIQNCVEILFENGTFSHLRSNSEPHHSHEPSIRLLRIRNPHGNDESFKGAWCSGSPEWNLIDPKLIDFLDAHRQVDGEFFISFELFLQLFDKIDTVHTDLNAMNNETFTILDQTITSWQCEQFFGEWIPGKNSFGRGFDNPEEYWSNPQYKIKIPRIRSKKTTSAIISLIQTDSVQRRLENADMDDRCLEAICFKIFAIKSGARPDENERYYEESLEFVDRASHYCHFRDVSERFDLKPNIYIIIPSLYEKNRRAKFLLRCFYEVETVENRNKPKEIVQNSQIISELVFNLEKRDREHFVHKSEPIRNKNTNNQADCSSVCLIL